MTNRLFAIEIDDRGLARANAEMDQERKVAIFDLLEDNAFAIPRAEEFPGPYRLKLAIRDGRLVFDISSETAPIWPLARHGSARPHNRRSPRASMPP